MCNWYNSVATSSLELCNLEEDITSLSHISSQWLFAQISLWAEDKREGIPESRWP